MEYGQILVEVTGDHILNGIDDEFNCPIALAIGSIDYRLVPEWTKIEIECDSIFVSDEIEIHMDNHMLQFIVNFDNGRPVKPFKFEIHGNVASTIL